MRFVSVDVANFNPQTEKTAANRCGIEGRLVNLHLVRPLTGVVAGERVCEFAQLAFYRWRHGITGQCGEKRSGNTERASEFCRLENELTSVQHR